MLNLHDLYITVPGVLAVSYGRLALLTCMIVSMIVDVIIINAAFNAPCVGHKDDESQAMLMLIGCFPTCIVNARVSLL